MSGLIACITLSFWTLKSCRCFISLFSDTICLHVAGHISSLDQNRLQLPCSPSCLVLCLYHNTSIAHQMSYSLTFALSHSARWRYFVFLNFLLSCSLLLVPGHEQQLIDFLSPFSDFSANSSLLFIDPLIASLISSIFPSVYQYRLCSSYLTVSSISSEHVFHPLLGHTAYVHHTLDETSRAWSLITLSFCPTLTAPVYSSFYYNYYYH